jgi:hypothetical protein
MKHIVELFLLVMWMVGFVVAKGFWSTLFCIIPFWAWYLAVEFFILRLS